MYRDLEPLPLPRELGASDAPGLLDIGGTAPDLNRSIDLSALAHLLFFSAGITKQIDHGGHDMYFRAAACTGALYHIELYIVCCDVPGLTAGVYHFAANDFSLRRLRDGDHRGVVAEATGDSSVVRSPATIVMTSTYWRNSWKYQVRAYRHAYWDSGTILANFLAVAAAQRIPARVLGGFADEPINNLLDLDTDKEVSLALVPVGDGAAPPEATQGLGPLDFETMPLSHHEVDYPAIRAMHEASSLTSAAEAIAWRGASGESVARAPEGRLVQLEPDVDEALDGDPVERVILRRGSSRRFSREPISYRQLSNAIHWATRAIPADFLDPSGNGLNRLYLIVHAVDGLPAGAYVFHRDQDSLELLKEGDFRNTGGYLGLEQELPADAAVDVFFLSDLEVALGRFGNRGYRAAQLEAAIMGGRLYLAAYGQGFGASGLTFYDDEVTDFFSPHAAGKSVMFLVALGVPFKRKRS